MAMMRALQLLGDRDIAFGFGGQNVGLVLGGSG
jgi:hypothetical protein